MKHLQIPSNKDQRLSKDIEKGDYSNKKKEKKMSAEDSLAEKPKVGRASDKKPSNKRLDSEKHLSNKNMKHLKTFESFEVNEKLTEEEKEEEKLKKYKSSLKEKGYRGLGEEKEEKKSERKKVLEADKEEKPEEKSKEKTKEEMLKKYKKDLKEKGYRGFDESKIW